MAAEDTSATVHGLLGEIKKIAASSRRVSIPHRNKMEQQRSGVLKTYLRV